MSTILLFSGSARIHWNFSPSAFPLNSSIARTWGSLPVLKSISLMILAAVGGDILFCTAILLMLRHLKLLEDLHTYSVSKLSISRQKIYTFIESFATFRTYMTAFSKVKNGIISWYGNIFYKLSAVIVDFACDGSAARAEVHSLFHSEPYMHFTALTFNICYNYIF